MSALKFSDIRWVRLVQRPPVNGKRLDWRPFPENRSLPRTIVFDDVLLELQVPRCGLAYYLESRQRLLPGILVSGACMGARLPMHM